MFLTFGWPIPVLYFCLVGVSSLSPAGRVKAALVEHTLMVYERLPVLLFFSSRDVAKGNADGTPLIRRTVHNLPWFHS